MNYKILKKQTLFKEPFFSFEKNILEIDTFSKTKEEIFRYELRAPEVVAALLYLKDKKKIILVEQFRYSAVGKSSGWILEIVAGLVEKKEDLEKNLKREILEETGYQVDSFKKIYSYYPNPGFTNQYLHFYFAQTSSQQKVGNGGGLKKEKEDIKVHLLSPATLKKKLRQGEILDSKTVIALQWFFLNEAKET